MKQIFARYLEESTKVVRKLLGTYVTSMDIFHLFGDKMAVAPTTHFEPDLSQKNAIVMVGKSCCGKTTFAKNFVKKHKEFEIVSMDQCAYNEMASLKQDELLLTLLLKGADGFGVQSFSRKLETGKQIIIDGGWLHLNSRIALIRTLQELGYFITIFSFLEIPEAEYTKRVEGRTLQNLAMKILNVDPMQVPYGTDMVKKYANLEHITLDEAVKKLRSDYMYAIEMKRTRSDLEKEEQEVMLDVQKGNGWITYGADEIFSVIF